MQTIFQRLSVGRSGERRRNLWVYSVQVVDLRKGFEEGCLVQVATRHDDTTRLLQGLRWYASSFITSKGMSLCI